MQRFWNGLLDWASRWLQAPLGFVVLVSGTLISFDYSEIRRGSRWQGLYDILESGLLFWLFIVSAVASLVLSVVLSRRDHTMGELKDQIKRHRSEIDEIGNSIIIVFDGLLLNLGIKLAIRQNSQVRMSLYVHDAKRQRFIPCGRHSPNPVFATPGRTSYPDNEGCIAEGWKRGWHFDNQVPDSGTARKSYNRKTYNVPESTNAGIKMASTLYAVRRLDDAMGRSVALIVVEAIEANEFEEDKLHDKLNEVADDFARMVQTLRDYIPDPANAAESGL